MDDAHTRPCAPSSSRQSERRRDHRSKIDLLLNRYLDGRPYMCRATDISRTGMRVVPLIEPQDAGRFRYMGLQFQLPGSDRIITASGEAVSCDVGSRQVGIRFTAIAPDHVALIDGLTLPAA